MKTELSLELIDLINKNEWIIFSTSDINNCPRSIIVLPSRIEKNRIIISNIQMKKSIENIKNNNKCFINVYCKDNSDLQIKISGLAKIYEDGELYNEIKEYEETNNLSDDLKVRSIIVIDFIDIEVTKE